MVQQRLPYVDGDDGDWGDILNQFIEKEHYNTALDDPANGGHQKITIRPGTATAGTAPLKFTSGTPLTAPEAGAIEFQTDRLYFTQTTGPTRKTIAAYDDASGATGDTYYRDASGNFVRLAAGSTDDVLKVAGGVPSWKAPKKIFTLGDGVSTSYALTHSFGTTDVITQLRQASDDAVIMADIVNTSPTVTTVSFAVAPATNAIKAVVMA